MKFLELRIPPPVVALVTAVAMWAIAQAMPVFEIVFAWQFELAVLLGGVGFSCVLAGMYGFKKGKTTINPLKPTSTTTIVTTGIYRFTRNPMYLGMLFVLAGWTVYLGQPLAFLMLLFFVIYINNFQIVPEERVLLAKFGDNFSAYKGSVRRWL